jgi:uncharacterized membrane protein
MSARTVGRGLLAALFVGAGLLHFIAPRSYQAVMPAWLPWHAALVAVSGAAEIAGGVGVLVAPLRRAAGWGLIALSIAVLPANVQMLQDGLATGRPAWQLALLALRLPPQAALVWWIWRVAARRR